MTTVIDTSPEVVRSITAYFRDKATRDVDATVAHFSKEPFVYIDATLAGRSKPGITSATCSRSRCRIGRPGRTRT